MAEMKMDELILRFFKEDIGGILITGQNGEILYEDEKTSFIRTEKTNSYPRFCLTVRRICRSPMMR